MKLEKILDKIKAAIYLAAGLAILIWNVALLDSIALLVGGAMLLYAAEGIAVRLATGRAQRHPIGFVDEIVLLLLAVLTLLVRDDLNKVCVIWAIWAILRERGEIAVVLFRYRRRSVGVISLVESVVVIALSFLLVLTPEEHVHSHVIILGIEMILEVLFPLLDGAENRREERKNRE